MSLNSFFLMTSVLIGCNSDSLAAAITFTFSLPRSLCWWKHKTKLILTADASESLQSLVLMNYYQMRIAFVIEYREKRSICCFAACLVCPCNALENACMEL